MEDNLEENTDGNGVLGELTELTYEAVWDARKVVSRDLAPTPLVEYPRLSGRLGCEAWIKLENTQPIGAFKVRGGLYLLSRLTLEERERGIVSATRGNHGQSLAYACRRHGVRCTLFVPHGNNPDKNAAMEAFGAELVTEGKDYDEAWAAAQAFAEKTGGRLVHPGNELALVAGVATLAWEMMEQAPGPFDAVFAPVGLGSCLAGTSFIVKQQSPETQVIGVQAENAPAFYRSFKSGKVCTTRTANTVADGLACRVPAERTLAVIRKNVDDMTLVSESEIRQAIRWYAETTHHMAEGAGAAALAGAYKLRRRFAGKRIGIVLSGGNIDARTLRGVLSEEAGRPARRVLTAAAG